MGRGSRLALRMSTCMSMWMPMRMSTPQWLCVVAVTALHACAPPATSPTVGERPKNAGELTIQDTDAAAAFAAFTPLLAAHTERVRKLEVFESRSSLELRYHANDGEHFDQCEADIFLAGADRGAVRITKVGHNLMWIGGNANRGWIFYLDSEPTRAVVYERLDDAATGSADSMENGEFALLTPKSVRVLMGIAAIPHDAILMRIAGAAADAPWHERIEVQWSVHARATVSMRLTAEGVPAQVCVRDLAGTVIATATLTEYVSVRAPNLAEGAWPRVARRTEVIAPRTKSIIRLFLDGPSAEGKRLKPKFFDLDALIAQMRPDSVEYVHRDEPAVKP